MAEQRFVDFNGKPQSFPADATDAEISAALGAIPASNAKEAPKARTWTDLAVSALPVAGGVVGAATGGIPGAILGAAGGEAWRQNIQRVRGALAIDPTPDWRAANRASVPSSASDAAKDIAVAGAESGALTGAGKLVAAGAPLARPLVAKGSEIASDLLESPISNLVTPRAEHAAKILRAFADTLKGAAPAAKIALSAGDVKVVQSLKAIGVSESEAVRQVMNTKARLLLRSVKP